MNNTFDFNRFKMVIRWDILSNWKTYFRTMIGLAFGITLLALICLCTFRSRSLSSIDAENLFFGTYSDVVSTNILIVFTISFYIFVGNCFRNMKTKIKRENFLMLPASNLEKYLSRLLNITVGGLLLTLGATIIADFIQFLFSFILTPGLHTSITWNFLTFIGNGFVEVNKSALDFEGMLFMLINAIFVHSFFTLGATFFRKHPILSTTFTGLLLMLIIGYAINGLGEVGVFNFLDPVFVNAYSHAFIFAYIIIFLVISAFNYWASYKLFTRMQVICNKWINI